MPALVGALDRLDPPVRAFVAFGGAFLMVAIAEAIGSTLGAALRDRLGRGVANRLDAALGALFGIAQALVLAWLVGGLLATGPIPSLASEAQRAIAVRSLLGVLPPPSEVAGEPGEPHRRVRAAPGLQRPGAPARAGGPRPRQRRGGNGSRPRPSPASSAWTRRRAASCSPGRASRWRRTTSSPTPTSWRARPAWRSPPTRRAGAAGARSSSSTRSWTSRWSGRPTWSAPARFAPEAPGRGTVGAALGHPNGGALTVIPAAVSAEVRARGRDLYATRTVVRDVLELRAPVEPGDSGGPFVLADGSVGGVVFAESRTDPEVGYALDPLAVADRVMPLLGRTAAVDTGRLPALSDLHFPTTPPRSPTPIAQPRGPPDDRPPRHPYDRPSDPAKRHSAALTDGPDRAAARAMLKAIGFTDDDLARPIVGVATTWIETMPCNYNQRRLAEFVKEGIRAAGGTPMEFNTISISDGVIDGHRGHEGVPRQPRGRSPIRSSS